MTIQLYIQKPSGGLSSFFTQLDKPEPKVKTWVNGSDFNFNVLCIWFPELLID